MIGYAFILQNDHNMIIKIKLDNTSITSYNYYVCVCVCAHACMQAVITFKIYLLNTFKFIICNY